MPALSDHSGSRFTRILYIGDSGTGKTGSLVSLMPNYRLRFLDMDNGLDSLVQFAKVQCPDRLSSVDYETRRDKYRSTAAGPVISGQPKAFNDAMGLLTKWSDESDPSKWGPETILVIDSLSALGKAAFEWARGMNPTSKDPRQWFFMAQEAVEKVIMLLTSDSFETNVIVISHVNYKEITEGVNKGYANAIGSALGPVLPRYFNTLILAESSGIGKNTRRRIKTMPTGVIDLKTPIPTIEYELPLETGMSTLFKALRG